MVEHDCRTCRWFHKQEGYCIEQEVYRKPEDGKRCDMWELATRAAVAMRMEKRAGGNE